MTLLDGLPEKEALGLSEPEDVTERDCEELAVKEEENVGDREEGALVVTDGERDAERDLVGDEVEEPENEELAQNDDDVVPEIDRV